MEKETKYYFMEEQEKNDNLGIVQRMNVYSFRDAFSKMGRKDQFSYEGLGALFYLLDEINGGKTYELDVIGLCCDFREYESLEELQNDYKDLNIEKWEDIEDHTIATTFRKRSNIYDMGIIIQAF